MSELIQTPDFNSMTIGALREYASHLRLALEKTATKQDIIDAINKKIRNRAMPEIVTDQSTVRPGYAKIRIHEDPMPGAKNYPVYLNANGYECTVPRGVDVIVPMRVVRVLNDAVVFKKKQIGDPNRPGQMKDVDTPMLSYPFQVLEMVPGPEVLTALEMTKKRTMGPRMKYHKLFGRWPRNADLVRAIEKGLVSISDDEEIGVGAEAMIDNDRK